MSGPPPKPARLRALAGGGGHRPMPGPSPRAEPGMPPRPAWLVGALAIETWDELGPQLVRAGTLSAIDGPILACYCAAVELLRDSMRLLDEGGLIVEPPNGIPYPHPATKIRDRAVREIAQFGRLLGIGALSRMSLDVTPTEAEHDSDEARIFGGGA